MPIKQQCSMVTRTMTAYWDVSPSFVVVGNNLAWNLAYDVSVVCFADTTIMPLLAKGDGFQEVLELAELGVGCVFKKISGLGLWVVHPTTRSLIKLWGIEIEVGRHIKFLGLTLDSHFKELFERMILQVWEDAGYLQKLLPNSGYPREEVRCPYGAVIQSMAFYGVPIWVKRLKN